MSEAATQEVPATPVIPVITEPQAAEGVVVPKAKKAKRAKKSLQVRKATKESTSLQVRKPKLLSERAIDKIVIGAREDGIEVDYASMDADNFIVVARRAALGFVALGDHALNAMEDTKVAYFKTVKPAIDDARRRFKNGEQVGDFTGVGDFVERGMELNLNSVYVWEKRQRDAAAAKLIENLKGLLGNGKSKKQLNDNQKTIVDALVNEDAIHPTIAKSVVATLPADLDCDAMLDAARAAFNDTRDGIDHAVEEQTVTITDNDLPEFTQPQDDTDAEWDKLPNTVVDLYQELMDGGWNDAFVKVFDLKDNTEVARRIKDFAEQLVWNFISDKYDTKVTVTIKKKAKAVTA